MPDPGAPQNLSPPPRVVFHQLFVSLIQRLVLRGYLIPGIILLSDLPHNPSIQVFCSGQTASNGRLSISCQRTTAVAKLLLICEISEICVTLIFLQFLQDFFNQRHDSAWYHCITYLPDVRFQESVQHSIAERPRPSCYQERLSVKYTHKYSIYYLIIKLSVILFTISVLLCCQICEISEICVNQNFLPKCTAFLTPLCP